MIQLVKSNNFSFPTNYLYCYFGTTFAVRLIIELILLYSQLTVQCLYLILGLFANTQNI